MYESKAAQGILEDSSLDYTVIHVNIWTYPRTYTIITAANSALQRFNKNSKISALWSLVENLTNVDDAC